jgi:hypothetical protein
MKDSKPSRDDIVIAMDFSNLLQLMQSANPQLGIFAKPMIPIT